MKKEEGNHLICTQRDNKGKPIAWMLIYVDKNGKEHPGKPLDNEKR